MRILVLGGYGLIGSCVVRHLLDAGHAVVGLGRDVHRARLVHPDASWISADLSRLTTPTDWARVLSQARPQAIVNCAGALQDGMYDDVAAVQARAMTTLFAAAQSARISRLVQISAPGADAAGETTFMRSKGVADAALAASSLDWVIFRPGLVLAPQAYGGSALLRALAAFPMVQPLAFAGSRIQTVAIDDVARAVVEAVEGRVPSRRTFDLVEDHSHTMRDVVEKLRGWLGYAPAAEVLLPPLLLRGVARIADGLGWLGWRAPLRTTALIELRAGVVGDARGWRTVSGGSLASLDETLRRLPSTVQERWFARSFLVKPLAIATLAAFWLLTGLVALGQLDTASRLLVDRDIGDLLANSIVVGGALVDIVLGAAILVRRSMRPAAIGMVAVTLAYILGGTVIAPDLWLDPLGPLLKPLPGAVLAIVVLALAEDR